MSDEKRFPQLKADGTQKMPSKSTSDSARAAHLREEELDEFWDISALIPPKKKQPPRMPTTVTLTEIVSDDRVGADSASGPNSVPLTGENKAPGMVARVEETRLTRTAPRAPSRNDAEGKREAKDSSVITRFIPPHAPEQTHKAPEPEEEYTLEGSMLHRVRIYRWKTTYQYYEDFCKQATALYDRHGEPCAPVSFFSYVPQYSQMNRAQLNWYLFWRDGVRRGEIMAADYSYILLYIYEIINLADTVDVRVGQQQLCALREAFCGSYPRLGHLLGEWICDYSLIHHLPPPVMEDLSSMADCTLKEFYAPSTDASDRFAAALMVFGSNYAYTKSKFAAGDNRALYDQHMLGALRACITDTGEVGARMAGAGLEESRLIRDAYTGALCSHRVKRRIEVDYCSFARSHELRILVTDIMKYTENKLRAYLGVKSRLGLYALPQSFRDCVDRYMRAALPARERAPRPEVRQEYEALYDVPATAFSAAHAAEIEAASWHTTERLIAAFDDCEGQEPPVTASPAEETARVLSASVGEPCVAEDASAVAVPPAEPIHEAVEQEDESHRLLRELGDLNEFLNLALRGDTEGQRAFARSRGEMTDSIADRINELAAEILGDVLLKEGDRGGYTVIEDYRSMLEES